MAKLVLRQRGQAVEALAHVGHAGRQPHPHARRRRDHARNAADSGGRHWAIIASLIQTAKLNDVDPLAWLTDVLEGIVSGRTGRHQLGTLLPWNWKAAKAVETPDTV